MTDHVPPAPGTPRVFPPDGWAPLRALAFVLVAVPLTLGAWAAGFVGWLLDPVGHRLSDFVLRLWGRALLAGSGLRIVIEGAEHREARELRVLAANHGSWLDPAVLAAVSPGPLRFVLKRELIRLPFVGWHTWLTGHFLIDRTDPRAGIALLDKAVAYARRRRVHPAVFPEGTRSRDGRLAELKGGAVQVAMATGFPLQPIAILGTYERMPRGAAYPRRGGTLTVRFGPPLSVAGAVGGPGRRVLTQRLRAALIALGVPDGLAPGLSASAPGA
jgi:1-acyl-sn-glycerol-3-phosphate acyltransferase